MIGSTMNCLRSDRQWKGYASDWKGVRLTMRVKDNNEQNGSRSMCERAGLTEVDGVPVRGAR